MTNTEAVTYIRPFAKVRFLVEVESSGLWVGDASPVMEAVVRDGHIEPFAETGAYRLTASGRDHLAGFRALLAPAD